jgi:hypothetical protein
VVRELTAEKLRKEQELLELAKEALVLQQGVVLSREPTDASYVTNSGDISLASMSLSRSKVSGVFSSATATGMQVGSLVSGPIGLVPPPPAGGFAPNTPWATARQASSRGPWIVGGIVATAAALLMWLWWMEPAQPIASELPARAGTGAGAALPSAVEPTPTDPVQPAPLVEAIEATVPPVQAPISNPDRTGSTRDVRTPRLPRPPRPEAQTRPPALPDDLMVNPYRRP